MKLRIGKLQLQISVLFIIVPPAIWITGSLKEYAAAFFSIVLHELGHITVARLFGRKPYNISVMPVGLSVSMNDEHCSRAEALVTYSAGPAVNLLIFALSAAASQIFGKAGFLEILAFINAYLAVFNLIPAFPMDGGRILLELLAGRMGLLAAGRITRRLALLLAFAIAAAGILQICLYSANFSLVLIGLYIIAVWKNGKLESAFMNIKQILYRRSRFLKKGIYQARDLVAVRSTRLDETVKNMDYDRFHLVYVLDDKLRLLRIFTESEILDAVSSSEGITFGQLLDAAANGNIDI